MSEIGIEISEILHQHIIHNNNNNSYNITKYSIAIYLVTALILATVCFVVAFLAVFSTDKGGSYLWQCSDLASLTVRILERVPSSFRLTVRAYC